MRDDILFKKIGDVCEVIPGQSPKSKFYNNEGKGLPFYQGKKRFTEKVIGTPVKWTTNITKEAVSGDILMSVRAPVGPVNFATQKICIGRGLAAIRPQEKVERDYLFYFFLKNEADLESTSGAVFDSINSKQIRNIKIPILPHPEQRRIVAILDEALETIDHAKANIEKNIQNAEELFQSKLNDIFTQRGEGWEEKSIEETTNVINGYAFKSKDFSSGNPIKAIKITNVGVQEFVEDTENNLPNDFLDSFAKVKVGRGDIVIALTRTIISSGLKVARVPETYDGALVNQRVAALSPIKEVINPTYLYHFLSTDIVSNYVLSNVNTLMQPNLSIRDLRKLKVPICSISKQKEITFVIDSLWDNVSKIIEGYQRELKNIEELKKSILQKAFSGELTAKEQVAV